MNPKLFFFDTEIAKNLYAKFPSKRPEYNSYRDRIVPWWLICWAGQWSDSKKIISASPLDIKTRFKRDPLDDFHTVKSLYDQIKDADAIIGHNMEKFDWMKFMARVTYHKMRPLARPRIIDTMKMAKAIAAYDSYSLNFLCTEHNLPTKVSNRGNELWNDIAIYAMRRDFKMLESCITEMVVYCKPDVIAVKALYEFLLPYAPDRFRINQNLFHADGVNGCAACQSDRLNKRGFSFTANGKYQRLKCMDCGSWSTDKKNLKRVLIK